MPSSVRPRTLAAGFAVLAAAGCALGAWLDEWWAFASGVTAAAVAAWWLTEPSHDGDRPVG